MNLLFPLDKIPREDGSIFQYNGVMTRHLNSRVETTSKLLLKRLYTISQIEIYNWYYGTYATVLNML